MSDFRAKMHKIRFPDPARGAYSVPSEPLAVFKGPTSKGRAGEEGGEEKMEEKGRGREEEGEVKEGGQREGEGRGQPPKNILA